MSLSESRRYRKNVLILRGSLKTAMIPVRLGDSFLLEFMVQTYRRKIEAKRLGLMASFFGDIIVHRGNLIKS